MRKSYIYNILFIALLFILMTETQSVFLKKQIVENIDIQKTTEKQYYDQVQKMQFELYPYDPVANVDQIVKCGNARFTVLTDQLIRLEYDTKKQFVDNPTLAIVNRNLTIKFNSSVEDNNLTISTKGLELKYQCDQEFSANSLSIQGIGKAKLDFLGLWHYGDNDSGNLYGTIRTLDGYQPKTFNCTIINDDDKHCEFGVISKDGWVVYDDSENYIMGESDWVIGQNPNQLDLYFFGHGKDYKQAMKDFSLVAGSVPVPPKYSLGVWWTRWLDYNDRDLQNIFDLFKKSSLPMDVTVLDMNWHQKNNWGGYTFDSNLFPYVNNTLKWIHQQGPKVAMNLHDCDGVSDYDSKYVDFCNFMGIDPNSTKRVEFQICSSLNYSYGLEDLVLKPLEDMGVDFWWTDWQQGETDKGNCPGKKYNPTIQLNKIRDTDFKRRNLTAQNQDINRRIVFSRWGGMGNHRYQVGFSGDVPQLNWENLALQPYMSAVAGNVGFGFWSHDITGPGNDMELYIRWTQWGSLSSIMRFHERGQSTGHCAENVYPDPPGGSPKKQCAQWTAFDAPYPVVDTIRNSLDFRTSLLPYLYTEVVFTFLTGTPFLRPLYYDFPLSDMSFQALTIDGKMSQYMLGDQIMVCPIVSAVNNVTNMVQDKNIWIPEGEWFEMNSGNFFSGEQWFNTSWDLTETPIFVKAGSIIPRRPKSDKFVLSTAMLDYSELQFDVYPGSQSRNNTFLMYEDDGNTLGYLDRQYSFWNATSYYEDLTYMNFTLDIRKVKPWNKELQRTFTVRFMTYFPALKVSYQTKYSTEKISIGYSRFDFEVGTWNYDSEELCIVVRLPQIDEDELPVTVHVEGNFAASSKLAGYKGVIKHANMAKFNLDQTHTTPSSQSIQDSSLIQLSSFGEKLAHNADPAHFWDFTQLVFGLPELFNAAYASVKNLDKTALIPAMKKRVDYSIALMQSTILYNNQNQ